MSNINRDYLVILDVKTGGVTAPNMYFFNTDKKTNDIYVQLIVKETTVLATPIENATDFSIMMNVIKPGQIVKQMECVLVNESEAIYKFDLPVDFTNLGGAYQLEFIVSCLVSENEEKITSSPTTYIIPINTAFVLVDFRRGGRGIAFGKVSQNDTMEVNMELDLYAGRDNDQYYGADLNFCKVSNESQKIGWCGGTPSSNTLLQLYRHTDSSSGNSGTLLDVDKWNNCYYKFGINYFQN